MASFLFALTAAVLLAFTADAAVMKGTVTWQIDVTAFFQYSSTAQRTNLLNQILQLWKSSFDASSQLSGEKVSVVSDSAVAGFPGYKQVSFRITGQSPAGINVQGLVAKFTTILQGANIPGVQTTLSSSGSGGGSGQIGGGTINWEIQVSGVFQYANSAARDKILQQILALWTKNFAGQNGFKNQKISVISEGAGPLPGSKQLSFKITGSSNAGVNVQALIQAFIPIVQSAHIVGVQSISTTGGDNGGDNGGDSGSGSTNGGGGGSFSWSGNSVITFKTQADLDKILNQILQLWIKTYSVQYHISPGAKVTVISKQPAGGGKFTITYKITYSGDNSVSETGDDFNTIISNNKIPGVDININGNGGNGGNGGGNGGGGGSFTWNGGNVVVTFKTQADLDKIMNQILQLWIKTYTVQYSISPGAKVTVISKQPAGGGKYTITFKITYSASSSVTETGDDFNSIIGTAGITGVVSGGGGGNGNGAGSGGSSFSIQNTVVIKVSSAGQISGYLQKILALWIQTYSKLYKISGQKIVQISAQSTTPGYFTVTYQITGFSSQSIDADQNNADFNKLIAAGKIIGVSITITTSGEGQGNGGGNFAISENQQNGKNVGPGNFDVTLTVYLSYRTPAERQNFLDRLKVIWNNALNDYQVTSLAIKFQKETLNVGTLPKDLGGGPVNKVWYRLTGSTVMSFNTAEVSKVFEQTVVDAHLGGVEFTLQ